ncbi:MAG: Npt1/Npt2 family nucleotide transporter [Bacteroidota bacterium]
MRPRVAAAPIGRLVIQVPFSETLTRRFGLEEHEQWTLVLMGLLVAVLLCAYTLAKVVRDALFIGNFGALALPYAYVGVALASALFVWAEGRLSRRFPRLDLTRFNQILAIAIGIAAAIAYPLARTWTTALFYLWTGSQAMLLIPHFWVLALDVWDSHRARRLFPVLSGFGLVGGLVGGGIAGWMTPFVKRVGLIWIIAGLLVVVHGITLVLLRRRGQRASPLEFASTQSRWEILRSSKYLKLLAATLALSVIVGTLIDFQFKFYIQRVYPDPHALTQFLGRFQVAVNLLALVVQFGLAGWIFHRLGLASTSFLQPTSVLLFAGWVAATGGWWAVVAMRWIQGVVLQTLGKSTSEIYYMAVRPPERRRIKPAVDTLVERWSDAVVGLLLIGLLHAIGIALPILIGATIAIGLIWLVLLFFLNRQYGRAFQEALSHRWIEPEFTPEAVRLPAAEEAILQALRSGSEARITAALRLAEETRNRAVAHAVLGLLEHPATAVRVAAIRTAESLRLRSAGESVERAVHDGDERVSSAAIRYGLTMSRHPLAYARGLLDGNDPAVCRRTVEVLFERPHAAPGALTLEWIDRRIEKGDTESLILAARAIGATPGSSARSRLQKLLVDPDVEVKRTALLAAARRPSAQLLDTILPLLFVPEVGTEARAAVAAVGDPAVAGLVRLLGPEYSPRARGIAARTLADLASPRAVGALMPLARSADPTERMLGLRNLSRLRMRAQRPILPRALAHRLFLRELRSYRESIEPAIELENAVRPEVRLLAESYLEHGEAALERAMRALATYYDPKPLSGAFERLKSREFDNIAPALEFLVHVLPRPVFRPIRDVFESKLIRAHGRGTERPEQLGRWVREAWETGDAWLRACAVRASMLVPEAERSWFVGGEPSAIVDAELAARFPDRGPEERPEPRPGAGWPRAAAAGEPSC